MLTPDVQILLIQSLIDSALKVKAAFSYPMYVQAPNKGVSSKSTKADVTDLLLPRQPYN